LNGVFHQMRAYFNHIGFFINHAAIVTENFSGLWAFDLNPDIPEDIKGGPVDLLKVVHAENIQPETARTEQIGDLIFNCHGFTFSF
jgi:hypothetical protein